MSLPSRLAILQNASLSAIHFIEAIDTLNLSQIDSQTKQMQAFRTYTMIVAERWTQQFKDRELAELEFQQKLDQHAESPDNFVNLLEDVKKIVDEEKEATPNWERLMIQSIDR